MTSEVQPASGVLAGPLRRPANEARDARGSIHDDATASRLGFRGGTVAGSIHLELFPPLLVEIFGPSWFERGTLSINFRNATTDREPVRAFVARPPRTSDIQVRAWIEREDGLLVGEGTASVGEADEPTALGALDLHRYELGDLRILADVRAGDAIEPVRVEARSDVQSRRLDVVTDPLDWYTASPWGGPVASPATVVHYLFSHPARVIGSRAGRSVGLFGAIEIRHVEGPFLLDRPYYVGARVLALGHSPKTEYVWFESYADTPNGVRVAEMRMQLRYMKASSPLYQE